MGGVNAKKGQFHIPIDSGQILPPSVDIKEKIKTFPDQPGCYIMKNARGEVIYVGKAVSLKHRVMSYFTDNASREPYYADKIIRLRGEIADIDFISTETEKEALLLENELIKNHQPFFNVRLKDDKSFPFIMITTGEQFPRVKIIRGPNLYPQEHTFYGPYIDKKAAVRTLKILRRIFPFCTCKRQCKSRDRPCLYSQIGLCPAPCSGEIAPGEYMKNIRNIMRFLEGDSEAILADLKASMEGAVRGLDFERAVISRDQIQALEKTLGKQDVLDTEPTNKDIIASLTEEQQAAILVLHIRKGRVLGKRPYILDVNNKLATNNEILPVFLEQYYTDKSTFIPDQIVVERITPEINVVKRVLEEIHSKLRIIEPSPNSRDEGMLKIAQKNVGLILGQRRLLAEQASQKMKQIYDDLHDKIPGLSRPPTYIEAFDISNTQGSNPTASMVVFRDGQPAPQEYRRYRIRLKQNPDDVGMMKEVVGRRYSRLLRESKPFPDLILVDGGKGQLNGAVDTLLNLNLKNQPIIGLAKREEEVYVSGQSDPINLEPTSTASRTFQAIRNEAHRFAVTYHRLLRQKAESASELETIPGVGPKRHKQLLATFGSIDGIKRASLDELKTVLPSSIAQTVFNAISSQNTKPEKKKFKVWLPKKPNE